MFASALGTTKWCRRRHNPQPCVAAELRLHCASVPTRLLNTRAHRLPRHKCSSNWGAHGAVCTTWLQLCWSPSASCLSCTFAHRSARVAVALRCVPAVRDAHRHGARVRALCRHSTPEPATASTLFTTMALCYMLHSRVCDAAATLVVLREAMRQWGPLTEFLQHEELTGCAAGGGSVRRSGSQASYHCTVHPRAPGCSCAFRCGPRRLRSTRASSRGRRRARGSREFLALTAVVAAPSA